MAIDLTPINPNTIFEANATLITGVLILLTISSFSEKNKEIMKKGGAEALRLISVSIPFFVVSMGFLLGLNNSDIANESYSFSLFALVGGLIYLVITVFKLVNVLLKNSE